MAKPIMHARENTESGMSLIAEADRFMEQWESGAEVDYARSLTQLRPRNLPSQRHEGNAVAYFVPPIASDLN